MNYGRVGLPGEVEGSGNAAIGVRAGAVIGLV